MALAVVLSLPTATLAFGTAASTTQEQTENGSQVTVSNLTAQPWASAGETLTVSATVTLDEASASEDGNPTATEGTESVGNDTDTATPTDTVESTNDTDTADNDTETATPTQATDSVDNDTGTETPTETVDTADNDTDTAEGTNATDTPEAGSNATATADADGSDTDTGDSTTARTVPVEFRVDGDVVERRNVTLEPGESTEVEFTLDTGGLGTDTYIHGIYAGDSGEDASLYVFAGGASSSADSGSFRVSDLSDPGEVSPDEPADISATVTNTASAGDANATDSTNTVGNETATADNGTTGETSQAVELRVNGDVVDRRIVTLEPGESTEVEFAVDATELEAGVHTYGVLTEDFGEMGAFMISEQVDENETATGEPTETDTNETDTAESTETATDETETATPTATETPPSTDSTTDETDTAEPTATATDTNGSTSGTDTPTGTA
jgi:predicted component of type VI protein secretion system